MNKGQLPRLRIGHGFDAHRLTPDRRLILGGVEIPFELGALGHSDADVLAHAVADAVLGAAALGDIGSLFPDHDPAYRDANSLKLLEICLARVNAAGYKVENLDATIIVQKPRLAAFLPEMREHLARVLEVSLYAVSVKAKTTEGMGYTGDGTGIAAHAVVLLRNVNDGD